MENELPVREELRVAGLAEPISHYTDAVRYGDLLFVSGVLGVPVKGVPIYKRYKELTPFEGAARRKYVFDVMRLMFEFRRNPAKYRRAGAANLEVGEQIQAGVGNQTGAKDSKTDGVADRSGVHSFGKA